MSDSAQVQVQINDGVALLTMDDGKVNALSSAMLNELDQALTRAQGEAKAVVLLGRPGRFSGGFDLKVMKSGPAAAQALVSQGAELLMRIYEFPLPFVAACSGHAVAAGALMLLASDTRIGIDGDFKIGLNEVAIGMTMPILAQELARDRLAPTHLTPAIIQGTLYGPSDAVKVGYLDQAVAPEALVTTAIDTAAALGKLSKAYGATKARLRKTMLAHVRATLAADLAELTAPM